MIDNNLRQELAKNHKKAVIIGLAMAASVLVYVAVAFLLSQGQTGEPREIPIMNTIVGVCVFLALGMGVGIYFLRKTLLSPQKAREVIKQGTVGPIFFSATVIGYALAEAPAVFGLVIFLLGGGWGYFLALTALSIIYFLLAWPRLSNWEETCEEASKGRQ